MLGVSVVIIILTCFFTLRTNGRMSYDYWRNIFFFLFSVFGLLYVGTAFTSLRSREKTIWYLMIPSSVFEKFLYSFLERLVLFFILFPTIFFLFGNLAVSIVRFINSMFEVRVDQLINFSFSLLFDKEEWGFKWLMITGAFFFLSLAFAGAATFRKYPLIKSILTVGGIILLIIGYIFLITQRLGLNNPWIRTVFDHFNDNQAMLLVSIITFFAGVLALAFAYFKLKEKEVQ